MSQGMRHRFLVGIGAFWHGGPVRRCAAKAGRICFGADGGGERRSTAVCPATVTIACAAPITARFGNDNTLGTTQPAVQCNPGQASWTGPPKRTLLQQRNTCRLLPPGLDRSPALMLAA